MKNRIMTDNEKLAKLVVGTESDARIMNMGDEQLIDNLMTDQAKAEFNQEVDDYVSKFDKHNQYLETYKQKFKEESKDLELMPLYRYILVKPFDENPFQQVERVGNIIVDRGGQKPIYVSKETGGWEEEQSYVHVGVVIEVGPEAKYIKTGDVVMYNINSEVPIPFYKQGFVTVDETRVTAVINEKLHERFNIN